MSRSGLSLGLAFLATGFVLACQEQGSSPVEPEGPGIMLSPGGAHPHAGGGGTGQAEAKVTLAEGLVTVPVSPETQPVNLSENRNRLHFNAGAFDIQHIDLKIDLAKTKTKGIGLCAKHVHGDPPDDDALNALLDKLDDGAQPRKLFVTIDKNSLNSSSVDHEINLTWEDPPDGPFDLSIRFAKINPNAGSPTVDVVGGGNINDDFSVVFTGGSVVLRNRTGKPRKGFSLACPNEDAVIITLKRTPA